MHPTSPQKLLLCLTSFSFSTLFLMAFNTTATTVNKCLGKKHGKHSTVKQNIYTGKYGTALGRNW